MDEALKFRAAVAFYIIQYNSWQYDIPTALFLNHFLRVLQIAMVRFLRDNYMDFVKSIFIRYACICMNNISDAFKNQHRSS